jgi:Flp pilus assembly pilin Flp
LGRFLLEKRGQSVIEYLLLSSLIALMGTAVFSVIAGK